MWSRWDWIKRPQGQQELLPGGLQDAQLRETHEHGQV